MNTQNPNNVFVFDMDNTLIKTDKANSLAYSEAISSVLGVNYNIENEKRFTRNELKELFPQLTQTQINEIIDFWWFKVFETATVDSNIIWFNKTNSGKAD